MTLLLLALTLYIPSCSSAPVLHHGPAPEPPAAASGIPVITYHQITNTPSAYSASPLKLREDLRKLYDAGFFLIQPADIEDGLYRVPPDRRPLMITFDDGWEDNFRYIDEPGGNRRLDPHCAVAIVNDFLEEHPDFGTGVVFFISWDKVPFGTDTEEKLNQLLDMGHAIGNHTADHASFIEISPSRYHTQVLPALDSFRRRLGLRAEGIKTLAYPGGRLPRGNEAVEVLSAMEYRGRPAVVQGYLVDGAVGNFSEIYSENAGGAYRISRIDMALYSVNRLLGWRNLVAPGIERSSLHQELPWRP